MLSLALLIPLAQACQVELTAAEFSQNVRNALGFYQRYSDPELAIAAADNLEGFEEAVRIARENRDCLAGLLEPKDAALYHLMEGLAVSEESTWREARPALRASQAHYEASIGALRWPAELRVDEEFPLPGASVEDWAALGALGEKEKLPLPPPSYTLYVDGVAENWRYVGVPTLLQYTDRKNEIGGTLYLAPGEIGDAYPRRTQRALRRGFISVGTSALCFGVAFATLNELEQSDTSDGGAPTGLRRANDIFFFSGLGGLGAGAVFFGAASLSWDRGKEPIEGAQGG